MRNIGTDMAILASAVIVLSGLAALVRAIWRVAQQLRDNTSATGKLTKSLEDLSAHMDGRYTQLERRVSDLEGRTRRYEGPPL